MSGSETPSSQTEIDMKILRKVKATGGNGEQFEVTFVPGQIWFDFNWTASKDVPEKIHLEFDFS
jgi:hypothetical protein